MSVFIPTENSQAPDDAIVTNDGFFPDLSLADFKTRMVVGDVYEADTLRHLLQLSMLEVNESLTGWRETVAAHTQLADVPATDYSGTSSRVMHYLNAVYNRAKALLIERSRDYDSTRSGHDAADKLTETADDYKRQASESISRLIGRPRTNVELI